MINVFADVRCRGRAHGEPSLFCSRPFATHPLDIRYELLGASIAITFGLFGDGSLRLRQDPLQQRGLPLLRQ